MKANSNLKELTQQLVAQFCAGNDAAFSKLYDLYIDMLYNYGTRFTNNRDLLMDSIHDVFVKVYSKRSEKNEIRNFASYLVISLRNRILDEHRRETFGVDNEITHYASRADATDIETDYLVAEYKELRDSRITALIQLLTPRQRQAITLYYLEGREYDEICDTMHMNYHSIRNLVHRGMLKMRENSDILSCLA